MAIAAEAIEQIAEFEIPQEIDHQTELGVRQLMIRIRAREIESTRIRALLDQVAAPYHEKLARLEEENLQDREMIRNFIEFVNGGRKVSFPDIGTAYLQQKAETVEIEDLAALETYTRDTGAFELLLKKPELDRTKAKQWVLEQVKAGAEVPPGTRFVPPRKVLAIRF